ncbi:YodL domain-containing protein [Cytobacillus massiliigabonensis]|uniref:YodL domain-containing protein n=1 Tax=Cytobacillus massiliigabonensis TaxID=1871011 RepID=UPI000C83EF31|nr:YodL domain-containing protein [Cytobacillus massiliigabonensis]
MLKELTKVKTKLFDVTIFQTPEFRQNKGYRQVYRLSIEGGDHEECLYTVFATFNVPDLIPKDFTGRFIATGDILFIDEGRKGQFYYQLQPGGWKIINRVHIR